ncbi:hypothetical protein CAP39_09445 [Sphingomonas sp. IBVSS1]|uniref:Lipoprotein n=1 Tax=Sandarakinorhabdus cyanobacteriorum TaxID=1981098 RepID=A0A255YXT4_9SPHN|nr:hypothetical protein CAP39_09445 [Sphingomonas sp. IBVSS1]OYQ33998.1 hypothetical protein CHU93_02640 [Sandarakinorhabdus cyanobacteriorum]
MLLATLALAGCERNPLIVKRSACPAVAVAAHVGDVTLFRGGGTDAANIDAVGTITNVRDVCTETADQFMSRISFDVVARRTDSAQPRQLVLPVFAAVVQAGNVIDAKQVVNVTVNFAAGQERAVASATLDAGVSRKAASVSPEILARINRDRRPGDIDAATDPMADPEVRAALRSASFEVLLGFQIDERALAYNVAK